MRRRLAWVSEVHMKRLLLSLTFLVLSASVLAHADSLFFGVNTGSGDNFAYIGEMNGHQFALSGGTGSWFFDMSGYDPGSTLGGQTELYLYSTAVWVNGAPVDLMFPFGSATLFMTSFTLPTNGQDFSMFVQIGFTASGVNFDVPQPVDLSGSAQGWIDFHYSNGRYYASNFAPVVIPEPATLALVSIGLTGIVAAARRRFRR